MGQEDNVLNTFSKSPFGSLSLKIRLSVLAGQVHHTGGFAMVIAYRVPQSSVSFVSQFLPCAQPRSLERAWLERSLAAR